MTWLIIGGAGYIGAHVARAMTAAGESVVALDDLSSGVVGRIPAEVPLVRGTVADRALLDRTLAEHAVDGVVHLAARKEVAESVADPLRYYRDNVHGLAVLLEAVVAAGVGRFLFSSSAAVYGTPPDDAPVTEETPCRPVNPYGETKLAGEWLVRATGAAHGVATACLRYFNVAGTAVPELADRGRSNVVPIFLERLARGEAPVIHGGDYPTPDGTCVRDYVHVADVAAAHLAAARHLTGAPAGSDLTVNIGTGTGVSVRELAVLAAEAMGRPDIEPVVGPPRAGDPARVVAAVDRAREVLGFTAAHDMREMLVSAREGRLATAPEAEIPQVTTVNESAGQGG
ncbi:UDP-glucose 4-epimerase GalE [Streptomyces alkaliphilus]|uniref:UDP-glucose 4-epimerase GalE n=1 Tax=Streptomyces alkaliphilus TaxID=1472722 RepID=UPI00117FA1D0|nr:UDP-glucose 4-epimerase GalE [Streptomyces alkaliphilus]MQS09474.1 UDP-glucose 4-epimerase GalE [Streptomyces alkaliphilus]